jgi:hypothetical protein
MDDYIECRRAECESEQNGEEVKGDPKPVVMIRYAIHE